MLVAPARSEGVTESDTNDGVPAVVREWAEGVLASDEHIQTVEDAVVEVPSRFDRGGATARWRFDGTLTVHVREE